MRITGSLTTGSGVGSGAGSGCAEATGAGTGGTGEGRGVFSPPGRNSSPRYTSAAAAYSRKRSFRRFGFSASGCAAPSGVNSGPGGVSSGGRSAHSAGGGE